MHNVTLFRLPLLHMQLRGVTLPRYAGRSRLVLKILRRSASFLLLPNTLFTQAWRKR